MNVEFERFMPSDVDYNVENGEVSDNHGLAIVQSSEHGMQLWSIDQAATTSWSTGNFIVILNYSLQNTKHHHQLLSEPSQKSYPTLFVWKNLL